DVAQDERVGLVGRRDGQHVVEPAGQGERRAGAQCDGVVVAVHRGAGSVADGDRRVVGVDPVAAADHRYRIAPAGAGDVGVAADHGGVLVVAAQVDRVAHADI